jgi:[protein-PII] uridylyltransferase
MVIAARLREQRAAIMADTTLQGREFGIALAEVIDESLRSAFAEIDADKDVAIVALGSYGRRELCPGSDVDVLLVHNFRNRKQVATVREMTERLWYPLWDAGFVTGHGARSVKDSIDLADSDLDALTALLEIRHVAGDDALTTELERKARDLAQRRQGRVLRALADGAEVRKLRPGPVAEMLEPDLKEGAGGLRDVHALEWAGWALGAPGGTATLVERGYVTTDDMERVGAGREMLLDLRVALQRSTGSRSDRLALQDQDAVAAAHGAPSADALVRDLSRVARDIAWIASDVWMRLRATLEGPGGRAARGDRLLAEGVFLRDGRVHVEIDADGSVPTLRTLEAAAEAADLDVPFDRASLTRLRATAMPTWDVWQRAAFLRLLRAGYRAVPVFEALDHEGVLVQLMPEWEHVRFLPQRNAYHRFTVDRHLLEAVAECAELLDAGDAAEISRDDVDAVVARACRRPELLLLGALLHDIAKGRPGDHAEVGAETAETVARRIGLDSEGREILIWLVRNHLLMAEVATRRDLSDAAVADGLAEACSGDAERLRLLYLLTIGDSRATGPAAWNPSKAALVRDLFVKAAAAIERGASVALANDRHDDLAARVGDERATALLARLPDSYLLAFEVDQMVEHLELLEADARPLVHCRHDKGYVVVTVVAADRAGLLATLSGALTIAALDVVDANLFGTTDGLALDVFRAADPFGRVESDDSRVARTITAALSGELDIAARVEERRRAYQHREAAPGGASVELATEVAEHDTVVEVAADDDTGLLYRLASAFARSNVDVRVAKVATLGSRVIDVFYVRDAAGAKVDDLAALEELRSVLLDAIAG